MKEAKQAPKPEIDADAVLRRIEQEFAPKFQPDDPIVTFTRASGLLMEQGLEVLVALASAGMKTAIREAQQEMSDVGAVKLHEVNEEVQRSVANAVKALRASRNEVNTYLISALVEMRALVVELQQASARNSWRDRLLGVLMAGAILTVGIVVGIVFVKTGGVR